MPKPIDRHLSLPGVSPESANLTLSVEAPMLWYVFGIALAVIIAAAYVLSRRPSRRTTIVLERD